MINFDWNTWVSLALKEDIGAGDFSSLACIPTHASNKAFLLVKESGIIAGVEACKQIIKIYNPSLQLNCLIPDGAEINKGDIVFEITGNSRAILGIERLLLNTLQRMSGIASYTHFLTHKIKHTKTRLLDTRKTTPLFRFFEKWAVEIGGGNNHRMGLYDMIMLKDNHIDYAGGITLAVEKCLRYLKENQLDLKIEVEVRNTKELKEVLQCNGVSRIMLDNFTPNEIKSVIHEIPKTIETEASGGITNESIVAYAETGVDYISVGALTHQVKSLDLSLKAQV